MKGSSLFAEYQQFLLPLRVSPSLCSTIGADDNIIDTYQLNLLQDFLLCARANSKHSKSPRLHQRLSPRPSTSIGPYWQALLPQQLPHLVVLSGSSLILFRYCLIPIIEKTQGFALHVIRGLIKYILIPSSSPLSTTTSSEFDFPKDTSCFIVLPPSLAIT